jgi:hypothetical protein
MRAFDKHEPPKATGFNPSTPQESGQMQAAAEFGRRYLSYGRGSRGRSIVSTILIIVVLVLLLGGGGYYGHSRYGGAGLGGVQ